jgi:hypothetical protein
MASVIRRRRGGETDAFLDTQLRAFGDRARARTKRLIAETNQSIQTAQAQRVARLRALPVSHRSGIDS